MNWKRKALILRACAILPGSGPAYKFLQKRLGRLSDSPETRMPMLLEMARWLKEGGKPIAGSTFFEVGTGHLPTVPVCFSLMGAERFVTVDLYRRMDLDLLKGLLNHLARRRAIFEDRLAEFAPRDVVSERFDVLERLKNSPAEFLKCVGIDYQAPGDAARTSLPDSSIDCHLSVTVFEHIPPDVLAAILKEAARLLKDRGAAIHFIDPSDHFEHQDHSIPRTNFLQFSPAQWRRIAGNPFAYTNRLRAPDFIRMFEASGFRISRQEMAVDPAGIAPDFPLHESFAGYCTEELCTTTVNILAEKC